MTGIQEYICYNKHSNKRDLFCGKCGNLLRMAALLRKGAKINCTECGTVNDFKKEIIREFDTWTCRKKHSIRFWARKYGIPENSCYMAFRRRGIGDRKQRGIGEAKMIRQREFLAGIVYTKLGRELISKLILHEWILTEEEIKHSI